ncbi:MAG: hypothetical protein JJE04_02590 [Acidobacteriia bacterium]|nr:hypothetical protein [Terriglobia bacterium]
MKRLVALSIAVMAASMFLADPVKAQVVSGTKVFSTLPDVRFKVDGVVYTGLASFLWPQGSKHILEYFVDDTGNQYNGLYTSRYLFSGWRDNTGQITTSTYAVTITADPAISTYEATVEVQHQVLVRWYGSFPEPPPNVNASVSPNACGTPGDPTPVEYRPGLVYIDGTCYWGSTRVWLAEGAHTLTAYPYPGFVFTGWDTGQPSGNSPAKAFIITGPATLYPRFAPARRVNFRTTPAGLKIRVDRADILTTEDEPCIPNNLMPPGAPLGVKMLCIGEFDFLPGSNHLLGAPSPQVDRRGTTWILDSYSNGLKENEIYTVPTTGTEALTLTAKFVRGVSVSFVTQPSGLKLKVDDRDNWPALHFVYAAGTKHTVSAPLEQVDGRGRRYTFKRWSNGEAATQTIIVPDAADTGGLQLIAEFELMSQVLVSANPFGTPVTLDGAPCPTPCRIDRADGVEVNLSAPQTHQLSDVHRLDFVSWSDGAQRDRIVKLAGSEVAQLTMNYATSYRLVTAADPPEAAQFTISPVSTDGYYAADSTLTVTAGEAPGFKFRRWDIDLEGTSRTSTVFMARPRTILARYDKVPFISPAGVKNAAGETPEGLVSPGSLIAIYGANLASGYEVGPASPLSQTLAGVAVTVSDRILPLLFVSPEQINAQLPRDLPAGTYTLRVKRAGQPDVTGSFQIADSAPGLFSTTFDSKAFVLGQHEDGTALTPESPARRGELVTLFGTGFGRYRLNALTGFALPSTPDYTLEHSVEIEAGESKVESVWAGGAAGYVGMDVVRFRIGEQMPAAANLSLKIRVDGHESNTVLLPVE